MEWRKFFQYKLFPGGVRITHIGLFALLLLIANALILNWQGKEDTKPVFEDPKENKAVQTIYTRPEITPADRKTNIETAEDMTGAKYRYPEETSQISISETDEAPEFKNQAARVLRLDLPEKERLAAIKELAEMDPSVVIDVVMKALDSPSVEVREDTLDALVNIDEDAVNTPLLKAMEDENPDVIEKAMDIMGHIHSPNILPSLERAITDRDEDIREQALSILEDVPDPRAIDILIEEGLLNDYWSTREDALDSLGFITDQDFESYEEAREWWDLNRDMFVFDE